MPRPIVPVPDPMTKAFWDACNEKRLTVQYCTTCDRRQFPPEAVCRNCRFPFHLTMQDTSGRGTIIGYSITYDSRIVAWHEHQPYNNAIVALEEDPVINFHSNLPGVAVDEVAVGSTVEVIWEEVEGQLVPEWQVVS